MIVWRAAGRQAIFVFEGMNPMATRQPRQQFEADRHQPQLDGVRGIAIFAVLLAHGVNFLHVVPLDGSGPRWARIALKVGLQGWGGVDLFFVLSGFLITGILLRARENASYYRPFYMRRVLRIFPIYYLFLIVTLVAAWLTKLPALDVPSQARGWLPFFFYAQNWPMFWANWAGIGGLWGIFWSLAVEEQFYILWPALVRCVPVKTMLLVCVAGFVLGLPERVWLMYRVGVHLGVIQWPLSRLDGLFLGAAIALYASWRDRPVPLRWGGLALGFGAVLFGWIAVSHSQDLLGSGFHLWSAGVTAFALMSAGLVVVTQHGVVWANRLLTLGVLRVAGRLSYGMYVYHLVVYRLVLSVLRRVVFPRFGIEPSLWRMLVVLAVAICAVMGVAELSFRFVETPFLRLKRFFPKGRAVAGG